MASLRDKFGHFYAHDDSSIKTAMETGIFSPDTNVLLALYRFQAQARGDLFAAMEALDERLWVPHQVALEFHRNRLGTIGDQEKLFKVTQEELDKPISDLRKKVEEFGKRIALSDERIKGIKEEINSFQQKLRAEVTNARKGNEVRLKDHASDIVFERLDALLGDRIGEPMLPEQLREAREEARRRVEAEMPPGYMDRDKADPSGDYLIFLQVMNKAREHQFPVVLITDDEKEDWYRKEAGIPNMERPELRAEMMAEAGVPFFLMTTKAFLKNAKTYLGTSVSDETIAQAEELPAVVNRHEEGSGKTESWLADDNVRAALSGLVLNDRAALSGLVLNDEAIRRLRNIFAHERQPSADIALLLHVAQQGLISGDAAQADELPTDEASPREDEDFPEE